MHRHIVSFAYPRSQLLNAAQKCIRIRRHRAVRNRHIHKADSSSGAFCRFIIQPEFFGFLVGQHGHKNSDSFPRQRAYLLAKPIVATRPSDDGEVIGSGVGNGVYGCVQGRDIITGKTQTIAPIWGILRTIGMFQQLCCDSLYCGVTSRPPNANDEAHQRRDNRLHQDSDVVRRARGDMPSTRESPPSVQAPAVQV